MRVDLDSAACSIAYSYLASTLFKRPTVPLFQTLRADLELRAENLYAYEIARLQSHQPELLCLDDIPPESLPYLSYSSFVLVDHNRLASRFSAGRDFDSPPKVIGIIDHHDDEGFHNEADPRLITVPVGSCASLVTQYFMGSWENADVAPPGELASLLLCAILIDTGGLKVSGKAVLLDHRAVEFLLPRSTFASSSGLTPTPDDLERLCRTLNVRKQSVAHLSTRDLLRRDYKEYAFNSSSDASHHISVGIATVPLSIKDWLHKEASPRFWKSMDAWLDERRLDALGVLCTYHSPKSGEHKRQNLWIVKHGRESLRNALWEGMEASTDLILKDRNIREQSLLEGMDRLPDGDIVTASKSVARIWRQGNTKATRKVVAPLVKKIVEGF
jgi:exopolyphosphatase